MSGTEYILISSGTELLRVPLDCLMYASSEGNYSTVVTRDGRPRLVSLQLGQIEDLICERLGDRGGQFLRLGRGLIVNLEYVHVIDISKKLLIVSDCSGSYHELSASKEVLAKLKTYVESLAVTQDDRQNG